MKILLLVSSLNAGGAERVASTLVNGWAGRGDTVTLMPTFSGRGGIHYDIHPNVNVSFLADLCKTNSNLLTSKIDRLRALRRAVQTLSPDVVISFLTNVNIATLLATRLLHVPVIVCERVNPFLVPMPRSQRLARRLLYPFANRVVLQTEALAKECTDAFRPRWKTWSIPNPLSPEFQEIETPNPPLGDRPTIIGVGRLDKQKQFDKLILAFSKVAHSNPEWDLKIIGEGPLRTPLLNLAKELQLANRVKLTGLSSNVIKDLQSSEIFALTSSYEGFPNALIEAMAAGLPCIAFDCPSGPREISNNGQLVVLIKKDDVQAFSDGLQQLITNRLQRNRLGSDARDAIQSRYSAQRILTEWDKLFAEVLI